MQSKGSIISPSRKPPRFEQREQEIDVRLLEQGRVIVLQHQVQPERLQHLARLDTVESVVAVLWVEAASHLACWR